MAQINESELNHLFNFIGYGRLEAPVWFIGMEERASERTLAARLEFNRIEDLKDAHLKMNIREHHSGKKYIQPTWRGMCYVMLVREGIVPNKENIRQYQVERLGRHNGETLLTELLPLPRKRVARLQYKVLKTKFRSTEEY